MGFDKITYKGKPSTPDKGFKGKLTTINVAIEHNADGSVTVCKEIADEIYNNKKVPKSVRNYFKPTNPLSILFNNGYTIVD